MRLFQALEKCFPEIRKHKDKLYNAHPKSYWTDDNLFELRRELVNWITKEYLYDESIIYQLFLKADSEMTRKAMAHQILMWHIYDWNIEHAFNRKGTSSARK